MLATVSDRKIAFSGNGSTIDYYTADVVSAQDYYPFGMLQPGRSYNAGGYRYGFNGKENDNEVKGEGNQQDYGMRIYDPRVGRFLSVDPITKEYPQLTPYQFASNTPIIAIDLDGLEAWWINLALENNNVEGFETEQWLSKTDRVDGIKITREGGKVEGIIRELKPNSAWGRKAGPEQLQRYIEAAAKKYPDVQRWIPELQLYGNASIGGIGMFYLVKEGDNLSVIAEKFGMSVEQLQGFNNWGNTTLIKPGQELLVDVGMKVNNNTPSTDHPEDQPYLKTKARYEMKLKDPKKKQEKTVAEECPDCI